MDNATTSSDPRFFAEGVRVAKFHTLAFAQAASEVGTRQMLVLGAIDDKWGKYWVASYRNAAKLVAAGYEVAR